MKLDPLLLTCGVTSPILDTGSKEEALLSKDIWAHFLNAPYMFGILLKKTRHGRGLETLAITKCLPFKSLAHKRSDVGEN